TLLKEAQNPFGGAVKVKASLRRVLLFRNLNRLGLEHLLGLTAMRFGEIPTGVAVSKITRLILRWRRSKTFHCFGIGVAGFVRAAALAEGEGVSESNDRPVIICFPQSPNDGRRGHRQLGLPWQQGRGFGRMSLPEQEPCARAAGGAFREIARLFRALDQFFD